MAELDTGAPTEYKKYQVYSIATDPDQDDKATEIKLCSFARPHMRAFHCNWWAFFIAFCIWFCIAPLLPEIKKDIGITKQDVWTSNIIAVAGTICVRFIVGPLCDKFGARVPFALTLCVAAIPTAMIGLVNSAAGLSTVRLFIGIAGGTFVMCQFWSYRMFAKQIVGTANALCAGWGNLGGGVTQLVTGTLLFPLFKIFFDGDSEKAWRTVCIVPAFVAFVTGILIYRYSDDCPKGNYAELKKNGTMVEISAVSSFRSGAINLNSWIMFFQYACCFGVEITMNHAAASYFKDEFGQSTESAAAIASLFGFMNIFSRPLGGYFSDCCNARWGMRGRIWLQTITLCIQAVFVLVFAQSEDLAVAIVIMVFFSLFAQGACGTSYGIVPYIDPPATGAISGIVGAGGNCGAVGFGMAFRQLSYKKAFMIMGFTIFGSAALSLFIKIKGCSGMLFGTDDVVEAKTLTLPEPDAEAEDMDEADADKDAKKEIAA